MRAGETANSKSGSPPRREVVAWMRGVSRYFATNNRAVFALTQVNLEVGRGEVFGLLGPGGSGKSTTLRILAGRLLPSEGKVRVFGRPPRRRSARRRVGYLPGGRNQDQTSLFAEALRFLRNRFHRDKPHRPAKPPDLMLAEKRRLALKQLAARNPDLLLLDEPFAELDAAGCAETRDLIVAFARRGKTVILASDSLTHAKDICDRFAVYCAGTIETIGTLDEILATTDAIRLIGPVLPQETAQRLLKAIRKELGRPGSMPEPFIPRPQGGPPICTHTPTEKAAVEITAEEVLAPLVANPLKPLSNVVREEIASPIDHEKLAALTKPGPNAAPHESASTT